MRHESHSHCDFCCAARFLNKLSTTGGDGDDEIDDNVAFCFGDKASSTTKIVKMLVCELV